jgi:pyruvate ferredoxin oxidoreductase beta subunit/2-oxoisovalerate ferredoxin oxidoreductase beta subunit
MSIGLQWLGRGLKDVMPTMIVPACCAAVAPGPFPHTAFGAPTVLSTFASAAAVASGVSLVRQANGETRSPTICWAGDGGTYDIGLATVSAAAERNEDVLYICYDNEIYGNTGGQRSGATPLGARTTTTPEGKAERKKDIMAIMASHRIPYAATLSLAHPEDLMRKLRAALAIDGFRFLLLLSPCPAGWKSDPANTVELVRMAVRTGLFPLYEVFDGLRYRINVRPDGTPLREYLSGLKWFKDKSREIDILQSDVHVFWARLDQLEKAFPAAEDEGRTELRTGGAEC